MTHKILALADLHLRENKPECRDNNEDWIATIDSKMTFISKLADKEKVNCIIIAGDIFDSWRTNSMEFLITCAGWLKMLNKNHRLWCIPGNHDSMGGSISELKRSPYTLMANMGVFQNISKGGAMIFYPYLYSDELLFGKDRPELPVYVMHRGMYYKKKPFDEVKDENNIEWFVENCVSDTCKLIISGDYHIPFTAEINGKLCVNCGSVFRLRADQINYKPKASIITMSDQFAKVIDYKEVELPLSYDIHREHIDEKKELYEKLSGMLETVDDSFEVSLNFKDNFKRMIANDQYASVLLERFERMYDYK